jgi:hypothetical protein
MPTGEGATGLDRRRCHVERTGNAIMHLDPDDLTTALERSRDGPRPRGVVSLESRNAAAREWERWTRDATYGARQTRFGRMTGWVEVTGWAGGAVTSPSRLLVVRAWKA